jgi:hypothetical protein
MITLGKNAIIWMAKYNPSSILKMAHIMLVVFQMTNKKAEVRYSMLVAANCLLMGDGKMANTLANYQKMEKNQTEKENLYGLMVKNIQVDGKMAK